MGTTGSRFMRRQNRAGLGGWNRLGPALLSLLLVACGHAPGAGPEWAPTPRAGNSVAVEAGSALGKADCADGSSADVLVVGAGLAGLAAGRELARLGHSVLILEATDRIGGRGFVGEIPVGPGESSTVAIDYGGAWIHGVPTNPLTPLVDGMGFERVRSELDVPFYVDGRLASEEEVELFGETWEAYEEALSDAADRIGWERDLAEQVCARGRQVADGSASPETVCAWSMAVTQDGAALCEDVRQVAAGSLDPEAFCDAAGSRVRRTPDVAEAYVPDDPAFRTVRPLVVATAGPFETAAELDQSSAFDAEGFLAGEDDLVVGGLGSVIREYGEGLPVCLESPVDRVAYGAGGVTVHVAGRRHRGRWVVVTVPVGVLRAGKIAFEPPLPERKLQAIEALRMGHMQKVILPFREDLFGAVPESAWVLAETAVGPAERELAVREGLDVTSLERRVVAFVLRPLGAPIAIAFYGGEWARGFEGLCAGIETSSGPRSPSGCDDLAIEVAVGALEEIYGTQAVTDALLADAVHVTRWSLEPYTLGAYSVPFPGGWDQRAVLAEPVAAPGANGEDGALRLFFAGEACSRTVYNGSYPGAWETGLAAAREIHLESLTLEP